MQRIQSGRSALRALSLILPLGLLASLAVPTAKAQVYTDPVGFRTMTILGTNNGASPYITLHGLGMTQLPVSRGNATAVSANKIGVNATLTAGQFNKTADNNFSHFIELTSGPYSGLMADIVSNDTAYVYTADDISSYIGSGTTYKIYPHWTIGKLFGPNNEAGLQGGTSALTADNIQLWSVGSQAYATTYYFKTGGLGGTGWRSTASTSINASNAVVYIDDSLYIARVGASDVTNKLIGAVKLGPTISGIVSNGVTILGNVYPAGQPLGSSGLYTGSPTNGLLGGTSALTADNLQLWVPGSQAYAITYYFKTGGLGGTGWRSTASTSVDTSTNTIPAGASVYILRRPGNPEFNWSAPQPFAQ